jgi:hypothetical protein
MQVEFCVNILQKISAWWSLLDVELYIRECRPWPYNFASLRNLQAITNPINGVNNVFVTNGL